MFPLKQSTLDVFHGNGRRPTICRWHFVGIQGKWGFIALGNPWNPYFQGTPNWKPVLRGQPASTAREFNVSAEDGHPCDTGLQRWSCHGELILWMDHILHHLKTPWNDDSPTVSFRGARISSIHRGSRTPRFPLARAAHGRLHNAPILRLPDRVVHRELRVCRAAAAARHV